MHFRMRSLRENKFSHSLARKFGKNTINKTHAFSDALVA